MLILVCTHCAYTVFSMGSLGDAPIVRRPACLGSHAVFVHVQCMAWTVWAAYVVCMSACACTYALCLYLYNFWHDQPERRT